MGAKLNMKLYGETIAARDLPDGEIAVITYWHPGGFKYHVGEVVQRHEEKLVTLGKTCGHSWSDARRIPTECRVRVLKPGELIEVT